MTRHQTAHDRSSDDRRVTRRRVLATVGSVGALSTTPRTLRAASGSTSATFHVRVYPGPMPFPVWLRNECVGIFSGWSPMHRDVLAAVRRTMATLASYAERHSSVDTVESHVEPRPGICLSPRRTPLPSVADPPTISWEAIVETFRTVLRRRGEIDGAESCCHLLLWWGPLNHDLGYGITRLPNKHVAAIDGEGSQAIANVGATEYWDSRAVTRNMAIHEALHTFLAPDVVDAVVGDDCDHHLGSAVRTDEETVQVSPLATAYASPQRLGVGTYWHGTGCFDHEKFYRHDGTDDVERWEHTTEPSEGTRQAVTRYVERYLASSG